MLKFIKTLIGKLTLPEDVYVDPLGYYWVDDFWNTANISWPEYYRSIEQNSWGKWVVGDMYLGKNTPLKKLGGQS